LLKRQRTSKVASLIYSPKPEACTVVAVDHPALSASVEHPLCYMT
jgi:hypothetical protein